MSRVHKSTKFRGSFMTPCAHRNRREEVVYCPLIASGSKTVKPLKQIRATLDQFETSPKSRRVYVWQRLMRFLSTLILHGRFGIRLTGQED
jgi:hypothetical protein